MARVLAYHKASQAALPLSKTANNDLSKAVDDLTATLRCMVDRW